MEIQVTCPDAIHVPRHGKPDKKRKLSINPEKNAAHCWVCGYGTKDARALCERYGIDIREDFATLDPSVRRPERQLVLPPEFDPGFNGRGGQLALRYLINVRQFSRIVIGGYELGVCVKGKYAGRAGHA
jgi:hypothetical protein